MNKSICLVGNPNCGKTTLFNLLTGSNQKVGNWVGVTVDKKEGKLKWDKSIEITDLPGLYSLSPTSPDERVVTEYLKNYKNGVIINILDGTNLKRNLYLTLSLIKLGLPMVVAINMLDELKKEGIKLNEEKLSNFLGVPVIKISAKTKEGVDKLITTAIKYDKEKPYPLSILSEEKIYSVIEKNISEFLTKTSLDKRKATEKLDKVLTHGLFGTLIFVGVMFTVYFLSLKIGGIIGDWFLKLVDNFSLLTGNLMLKAGVNKVTIDLLVNAVIKGVGSVLSFLPHLIIMFFLTTALEESGYTARVAIIFDKTFARFSLSGKSIIPFILSCGCTVAGVESTKTIENSKERELTIMLSPFLPCGAKSAVFGWFSYVFFNGNALIALSLYLLSIVVLIIVAKIFTACKDKKEINLFLLELPLLRIPKLSDVSVTLKIKAKEFIIKSGTVILSVSIGIWLLSNFGLSGYVNGDTTKSFLYYIGNCIKYIFYPLGFGNWQASISVITGVFAKEAVVETMQILSSHPQALFDSVFSVYAFMVFTLLSPPCIVTLTVAHRELASNKKFIKMLIMEFVVAYIVALIINGIGVILSLEIGLILSAIIGIMVLIIFILCIKNVLKSKCVGLCACCKKVDCETKNNVRLHERG